MLTIEDAVIVEEHPLERLFDEHLILFGQRLEDRPHRRSKDGQRSVYPSLRCLRDAERPRVEMYRDQPVSPFLHVRRVDLLLAHPVVQLGPATLPVPSLLSRRQLRALVLC